MTAFPRLKSVPVQTGTGAVIIHRGALERIHLADEDGSVAALLRLLHEGGRDADGLAAALSDEGFSIPAGDVSAALAQFDSWKILELPGGDDGLPAAERERYQSNLRFFDIFADLETSSADQLRAIRAARVLLLGAGGLGSGILQSLVGLGVGRVTLVDCDTVEVKNLARQFVYGLPAVGQRKVDAAKRWAESYSRGTAVTAEHRRVAGARDIRALAAGADLVICAIDSPDDIHLIVNEACYELGIPFVAGGLAYSTLCYWSVHPGRSACRLCLELHRTDERTAGGDPMADLMLDRDVVNRATGPVVQVLAGLMTMEAMRFVTRAEQPVALSCYQVLELADGMSWHRHPWTVHPKCPLCPDGPA